MTHDANGYPTEEALEKLTRLQNYNAAALQALWALAKELWNHEYGTWVETPDLVTLNLGNGGVEACDLYLATGGWSGNEDVIQALRDNLVLWHLCWRMSARGGAYWFRTIHVGFDD